MNFINNAPMLIAKSSEETTSIQTQVVQTILVSSMEENIEQELKANLALSLGRLQLTQLFEPTLLLLHQFITNAVKTLHFTVFRQVVDTDFCISTSDSQEALEILYKHELAEHGDCNIARFCKERGLHIALNFPNRDGVIIAISYPDICGCAVRLDNKLADALGLQFSRQEVDIDDGYSVVSLVKPAAELEHTAKSVFTNLPELLMPQIAQHHLQAIFSQLDYGIVSFASTGSILAASPSILICLNLDESASSIQKLAKSIPTHFYNDVIWGLALEAPNGAFANYRIRVSSFKETDLTMLFNVSGYREQSGVVHTLWQAVSIDGDENHNLSEGSILNEARVHNITRSYVPQLVEERAREVVRLGGNRLTNEECFMAVLFCDIVGFTTYVENNEDEESVIHTLNAILRRVSKSATMHGGLIDKFMGDCIMVLFRNPYDAVLAALEMQSHSIDINNLRSRAGQEVLQLRIGIHWGKVIVGNVGTVERLDWTTIGDVVNTASRIENHCQPGAILISQAIRDAISKEDQLDIKCGDLFHLKVKGKQKALAVCNVYPT
jgi:adenylate cyclase